MKIGLLHLSDIHIANEDHFIENYIEKIRLACHFELNDISKLYIVITGDIANMGVESEYDVAKKFLLSLRDDINTHHKINTIKFVIVPGNHDCVLNTPNDIRDALLVTCNKDDINEAIVNECIKVQDQFWSFYQSLTQSTPTTKIAYKFEDQLTLDSNIYFHCYNSSWMSIINERDCNKIIPTSCYLHTAKRSTDIVVSLFHHPTSWLSPHTDGNNKKLFEDHLLQSSNIVLCGHEHSTATRKVLSLKSNDEFVYIEGAALKVKSGESSFSFIKIDSNSMTGSTHSYYLSKNDEQYQQISTSDFTIAHNRTDANINDDFYSCLTNIVIPIKHPIVDKITLPDIYIYPDLEPMGDTNDIITKKYKDALDVLESTDGHLLIEGDAQSGRTSLLYAYYYYLYDRKGCFPIYIKGKNIKRQPIKDIIKNCVKQQYRPPFSEFDYISKDISKRIILIDDIDKSSLNATAKKQLIEDLKKEFSRIIITTPEVNELHIITENAKLYDDFKSYNIKPFGYYKRNSLIEKWIKLGVDKNIVQIENVEASIKSTFDTITNLLGEQFVPSYPIFILSLLQSLNTSIKSYNLNETSYAYCYESLIVLSLMRIGVTSAEIGGIMNFVTEFAYTLYAQQTIGIHKDQFNQFYNLHKSKYAFSYTLERILTILLNSQLIKEEDEMIFFTYKYLSYYLTAQKISALLHNEEGYKEVEKLCNNLHIEESANILIFVAHKAPANNRLIEELLLASMLPFEALEPVTLDTKDPFFAFLTSFISEIKDDIVLKNNDPDEYRKKRLKAIDEQDSSRKSSKMITSDDFKDPNVVNISQTLKVVRILGQIIKNQQGVFEKDKLAELIKSSYLACFRMINFFSNILIDAKDEILDVISKKINNQTDRQLIQKKIADYLYFLGYKVCLSIFSNLTSAVGTSSLKEIYNSVASDIDSPAARIITFTINTYYGSMNPAEVEALMETYKDNPVAIHIIKARVANHLYNTRVDFKKKQRLCAICHIRQIN